MSEEKETMGTMREAITGEKPAVVAETPEVKVEETKTDVVEAVSQEPQVETAETAPKTEVEAQPKEVTGVLKGIQAERKKRQALEERIRELEGQINQYSQPVYTETTTDVQPSTGVEMKILTLSENAARRAHSDFQEKFDLFQEEAIKNPALYDMVVNSDDPGEAAYQAGQTLMVQKKYGIDLNTQISNIKKELESELKAKIRAEVEKELLGKIQTKQNQPTNLLTTRSASGAEAPFRPSTFADILGARKRG